MLKQKAEEIKKILFKRDAKNRTAFAHAYLYDHKPKISHNLDYPTPVTKMIDAIVTFRKNILLKNTKSSNPQDSLDDNFVCMLWAVKPYLDKDIYKLIKDEIKLLVDNQEKQTSLLESLKRIYNSK